MNAVQDVLPGKIYCQDKCTIIVKPCQRFLSILKCEFLVNKFIAITMMRSELSKSQLRRLRAKLICCANTTMMEEC